MTQPPPWRIDPELVGNQEDDKTAEKDRAAAEQAANERGRA